MQHILREVRAARPSGRAKCGAGDGSSATKYQSVCEEPTHGPTVGSHGVAVFLQARYRCVRRVEEWAGGRCKAGARPVHIITTIRTSRLSIMNSLSLRIVVIDDGGMVAT